MHAGGRCRADHVTCMHDMVTPCQPKNSASILFDTDHRIFFLHNGKQIHQTTTFHSSSLQQSPSPISALPPAKYDPTPTKFGHRCQRQDIEGLQTAVVTLKWPLSKQGADHQIAYNRGNISIHMDLQWAALVMARPGMQRRQFGQRRRVLLCCP